MQDVSTWTNAPSPLGRSLQVANEARPSSTPQIPQSPLPITLPNTTPIANNPSLKNGTPSAHIQPTTTTAGHQAKYRPLPTKTKSLATVEGTKKRKYVPKGSHKESRPIRYFEGSESDSDRASDRSGDGSSSGDSVASHWGQGVVSWAGTSQVHHKDMDKVPGKNPPGTLQVHSEFSQPVSLQFPWARKWSVHSQCPR